VEGDSRVLVLLAGRLGKTAASATGSVSALRCAWNDNLSSFIRSPDVGLYDIYYALIALLLFGLFDETARLWPKAYLDRLWL
jgi:hypothetical protein